jgi:hypothetical protein
MSWIRNTGLPEFRYIYTVYIYNNMCRTRRRMLSWQPCRKKRRSERRRRKRSRTTRRSWNGSGSGTTGRTITDAARAIGKTWVDDKITLEIVIFFCVMLKDFMGTGS